MIERQLRVAMSYTPPVDPLHLATMAEYDLSFVLNRSWFDYDQGRREDHGLIECWSFDDFRGRYTFMIENRRWSDGSALTGTQFGANLTRILASDTPLAKSLAAVVDILTLRTSDTAISFRTRNGNSSPTLFNQLASVFFSLVYPGDMSPNGRLSTNTLASGPYRFERISNGETSLVENPFFPKTNRKAPTTIQIRPVAEEFTIERFLRRETWNNYFQTTTMIPIPTAQQIVASKFPFWTRGVDRVTLFKLLGDEARIKEGRLLLSYLGGHLDQAPLFTHPLHVLPTKSLQPQGYPLFQEQHYPKRPDFKGKRDVRIFTGRGAALECLKPWLEAWFAQLGLHANWHVVTSDELVQSDWDTTGNDLVPFSFGGADPEPSTWLSLVFGKTFISYDCTDKREFEKLLKLHDTEQQTLEYRSLLKAIGLGGGYLPLLNHATLSLGWPGMNFDLVHKMDETVDYSKVQFEM